MKTFLSKLNTSLLLLVTSIWNFLYSSIGGLVLIVIYTVLQLFFLLLIIILALFTWSITGINGVKTYYAKLNINDIDNIIKK